MPIARYRECLRHARMYDLLGAVHASKPRPLKFAMLAGSAGGFTRGNRGPSAADSARGFAPRPGRVGFGFGFGTTMVGAGSEALARIRYSWVGSVSNVALTRILAADTVICREIGFS